MAAFSLFTLSLLLTLPGAQAGTYVWSDSTGQSPTYSGGQISSTDGPNLPLQGRTTPYSGGVNGATYGGGDVAYGPPGYGLSVNATGQITATFTWKPAFVGDPAPASAIVEEDGTASYSTNGSATGNCNDGVGDTSPSGTYASLSGTKYLVQNNPGNSFSVMVSPSATASAGASPNGSYGSASVTFKAVATPVTITLQGTTKDSSQQDNILVGQGCTASLNTPPFSVQQQSGWTWTVSGTTFEDWEPTTPANPNATPPTAANANASYEVDGYGPANQATANWYWNDRQQAQETVTCTATVKPPAGKGAAFTVTATQKVTVYVPAWTATGTGGYMQVNAKCVGLNGAISLYAGPYPGHIGGMDFALTVDTPQTPAFGNGMQALAQIVTPNNSYITTAATNPPSQHHTDPLNTQTGVDGGYPYHGNSTLETNELDPNDSPNLPLPNTTFSASVAPSFTDFLMYQPPSSGNGVRWVALSTFTWSANGSAQIPTQINPNGDWANFKAEHNGSDAVAGGTVSYPNTPTTFTPISVPNTFPKWTTVITAQGY